MDILKHFKNKKWVPLYLFELVNRLRRDKNLSDLNSIEEARENLGLTGTVNSHNHDNRYPTLDTFNAAIQRVEKHIDDQLILMNETVASLESAWNDYTRNISSKFVKLESAMNKEIDKLNARIDNLSFIPIGTVIIWPLPQNPNTEWLECNGQGIDGSAYPKLRALMSNTPDYRGVFLRGLGTARSTHWGTVIHSSAGLNELQGDAIRNIWGRHRTDDETTYGGFGIPIEGVFYSERINNGGYDATSSFNTIHGEYRMTFDASRVVPTSNENRPVNKAVRYFIKAK